MNRYCFSFSLFCALWLLSACGPQPATRQPAPAAATDLLPVTVTQRAFDQAAACAGHFVTHTLPFATGIRIREINTYESNGAGLAINDLDGDNDLDLVFASIDDTSAILWNEGNLKFTKETLPDRFTRGVATVDVDGDGALDIVFTHRGLQSLSYWRNQGAVIDGKRFVLTPLPGVDSYAYTMAWADLTGDGWLDLVTGSYNIELKQQGIAKPETDGRAGLVFYERQPDGFVAQPLAPNTQALSIALIDLNGDQQRDIWVANDFALQDRIWLRQEGAWHPNKPFERTSYSTMSIDWADITNNGAWALYATDMNPYDTSTEVLAAWLPVIAQLEIHQQHEWGDPQIMANTLQINGGDTWHEQGNARRVDATGWSWASKFGDLDQDGYQDLYVVNGMIAQNLFKHLPNGELVEENQALRNQGDGSFQPMPDWQLGSTYSGRGMSMADLDNDGDLDIVVNNLRQSAQLFENQLCAGASLQVEVRWPKSANPFGIGAQVRLQSSMGTMQRDVRVISSYLAGDPVRVHFGFPPETTLAAIDILWPDGAHSSVEAPLSGHLLEVTR